MTASRAGFWPFGPKVLKGLKFDAPSARRWWWAPFKSLKAPVCIKPLQPGFARGKTDKPPLRARKSVPPCPLRGTSPKGKRVTGFSVAQGLPTNPVPLPPRKRWQNKALRNNYLISGTKQSTGCCAPAQRGGKGTRFVGERQRPENRVTRFTPWQRWCRRHQRGESHC